MKHLPAVLLLTLSSTLVLTACGDDDSDTPGVDGAVPADGAAPAVDGALPGVDGAAPADASLDATVDSGPAGGCVDADEDGFGMGCENGPDCDDSDPSVHPLALERCNGVDDDCDGSTDENVLGICPLTEGVCAGATPSCDAGVSMCGPSDYGAEYEADESACDGLDNDCDGSTDEGCSCSIGDTQACGSAVGRCERGTQSCTGGAWGDCDGSVEPMGEACNGQDDDCDGASDEPGDLSPPDCPLQLGVCAGAKRVCGGVAGFLACEGPSSYGGDYQTSETLCDGLDNDCDGVTDEGCACIDGESQICGSDIGACEPGMQICVAGAYGGCAGEVGPSVETCDGVDDDCDRSVDEGVVGPSCALTEGVCAGSTQSCAGAGGFQACTPERYGPGYQAAETRCDGRDNDCDGVADEGCACVDGEVQPCGSSVGACSRGTQTCVGGAFGSCEGGVGPSDESCNAQDDDCDGATDEGFVCVEDENTNARCMDGVDNDSDGFIDCEDFSCSRNPSVTVCAEDTNRACSDGFDNDGDGFIDCEDFDCEGVGTCLETNNARCTDGVDNDSDGFIDCDDWDCSRNPSVTVCAEITNALCTDGIDNDGNGFTDCDDFGCTMTADVTVCG